MSVWWAIRETVSALIIACADPSWSKSSIKLGPTLIDNGDARVDHFLDKRCDPPRPS